MDRSRLRDNKEKLGCSSEHSPHGLRWPGTEHRNPRQHRGTNECSVAQRWPHLKCYKMDMEHKEGLRRHRDCKERVVQGGQWTKAGLGTTRRNSGDHPTRLHMVSGGQGLNTAILN